MRYMASVYCSGLYCLQVLNDNYVLFPTDPTVLSQDDDGDRVDKIDKVASVAGNRKNQYEEHLFQCEDERYEVCKFLFLPAF
jgi:histone deacetylase complex regulatory component SIN3